MNQHRLFQELSQLLAGYEDLLAQFEVIDAHCPAGHLQEKDRNGNHYYYHCVKINGHWQQIPIPAHTDDGKRLIQELREKRVALHERKRLKRNCLILAQALPQLEAYEPQMYLDAYTNDRSQNPLPDRVFLPGQLNVNKWIKETLTGQYRTNQAYPERLRYRTRSGTLVRSKSEVFWSDALEGGGWQFRYECALRLRSGHVIYPDFTVLLPAERRLVYIEHFGRMDDSEYAMRAMQRLQDYADNGYMLGCDVFFTTETSSLSLTSRQIDAVLQRLAS